MEAIAASPGRKAIRMPNAPFADVMDTTQRPRELIERYGIRG